MFFEKLKKIFNEKDDKKKTENLVAFLIILVVTLILVNKILKSDSSNNKEEMYQNQNQTGIELVNSNKEEAVLVNNDENNNLEENLENILSKINGVGSVQVLITFQTDNLSKIEGAVVIAEGARKYRNKEKYNFSS